jgi:hypothetical protein
MADALTKGEVALFRTASTSSTTGKFMMTAVGVRSHTGKHQGSGSPKLPNTADPHSKCKPGHAQRNQVVSCWYAHSSAAPTSPASLPGHQPAKAQAVLPG